MCAIMSSRTRDRQSWWPNDCTSGEKMHLSGLKEREVVSFTNLTQLYILYILARGGSPVRCEEMNWG